MDNTIAFTGTFEELETFLHADKEAVGGIPELRLVLGPDKSTVRYVVEPVNESGPEDVKKFLKELKPVDVQSDKMSVPFLIRKDAS